MYAVNTKHAYSISISSWSDYIGQELETDYDSSQFVDINSGKFAIMIRFTENSLHFTRSITWQGKIWSLTSLLTNSPF